MKTLNLNNQQSANETNHFNASSNTSKMNKLANVSPFLLLLLPVFVVMIVTFSISIPQENEAALKTTTKPSTAIVNITSNLLR